MKRILLVLALLAVVSLGFSVSGALYMRYDQNGSVRAHDWGGYLEDLRVGRRGTGFDLNFDSFTLSYKLRSATSVGTGVSSAYGSANVGTMEASTPGYVQLTGLKAGNIDLGIGASWWTFGESGTVKTTNTSGSVEGTGSASWNYFCFDFQMSMPIGDSMRLHIDPWDKADIGFGFGSANVSVGAKLPDGTAAGGSTNNGTSSRMDIVLPIHLDYNADLLGLEIFPKIQINSTSDSWNVGSATNVSATSSTTIGAMVRLSYTLNEWANIYAHVGVVSTTVANGDNNVFNTNSTAGSTVEMPIFAGVCLKPAGPVNLNLGIGYLLKVSDSTTVINSTPSNSTTNQTINGGGLQGEYNYFDEHGYKNPLLRFAGSAKFATDWEFGMSTIVYYSRSAIATAGGNAQYYQDKTVISGSTYSKTTSSQMLHFKYFDNWDGGGNGFGAMYLQYSKDNVTFRGSMGSGASGLAGLFSFVDASFAF